MKLTKVETFIVRTPPPHLGGMAFYFLRLTDDEGHTGWGETAVLAALDGLSASYKTLVHEIFNRHLKGRDAAEREAIHATMYARLSWQHPDYFLGGIISAFDTALWDLCGKAKGISICDMLGGRFRERIRAYSYIYSPNPKTRAGTPWERAELALSMVEKEGFTALKFDPIAQVTQLGVPIPPWNLSLNELDRAEESVRALREALGGACDILIGTHGQLTPADALRLINRLEPYDPMWFEEPVPPENFAEMAKVRQSTRVPIATGERLCTVHDFQKLFREGACAVCQPDPGSCGGITQLKKIAALAEANYILAAPHVWGGPVITAAALQIAAHIPNFLIQESIYTSKYFFDELLREPIRFEDGYLYLPEGPGLGIEMNVDALIKYGM